MSVSKVVGISIMNIIVTVMLVVILGLCIYLLDAPRDEELIFKVAIIILFIGVVSRRLDDKTEGFNIRNKTKQTYNSHVRKIRKYYEDIRSRLDNTTKKIVKKL